jgi:plastocyanin
MRRASSWMAGLAVVGLAACGGSDGGGTTGGSCTPTLAGTVSITATGVAPKAVCIRPTGTVTFTNNDTVAHDIEADAGCTPLNLGAIAPAASKVATFPSAEICAYHDALNATNAAYQGTVAVNSAPVTGPGY